MKYFNIDVLTNDKKENESNYQKEIKVSPNALDEAIENNTIEFDEWLKESEINEVIKNPDIDKGEISDITDLGELFEIF